MSGVGINDVSGAVASSASYDTDSIMYDMSEARYAGNVNCDDYADGVSIKDGYEDKGE